MLASLLEGDLRLFAPALSAVGFVLISTIALGQATNGAAQGNSVAPSASLQSTSRLVLIDVVVTDGNRAALGLSKDRFRVMEDGKDRPIVSFEEHHADPQAKRPVAVALPPHIYSNAATYPAGQAVNVLLLDGLNTPVSDQVRVRQQMLDYASKLSTTAPMAIFALGTRLQLLAGFTTDPGVLAEALKHPSNLSKPSVLEDSNAFTPLANQMPSVTTPNSPGAAAAQAASQFLANRAAFEMDARVAMTLETLQELARYLSGIPGRKNLIWFSGSFPIALDADRSLPDSFNEVRSYRDQVRETDAVLSEARVAVYPVDARGILSLPGFDVAYKTPTLGPGTEASGLNSPVEMENKKFSTQQITEHASLEDVAADTGGRAFKGANDLQDALAKAIEDGSSYYTITIAPGSGKPDEKFHKLKVAVSGGPSGGSYQLAYRRGYVASANKSATEDVALQAAIERGAPPATQIVVQARVLLATDAEFAKDARIASAPGGEMSAKLAASKQRYVADMRVDVGTLRFDSDSDGVRQAKVEMTMIAYDADGKRVNVVDQVFPLKLTEAEYKQLRAPGLAIRSLIDVPADVPGRPASLRIAVRQVAPERIGSFEVPLGIAAK
jgi:VWFA-related protein